MRVLGVVTARGGSKGIPRKNITALLGKPLLAYTAEAALAASRLTRTVLSTDDAEIAGVGRAYGLETPFMRPAELARDDTPTVPVLQHAVRELEARGERYDAVLTDVVMPGMSGVELAERVRQQHAGTGVVLVTGYSERAVQLPGVRALAKPYDTQQVVDALKAAMRGA